MPKKYDVQLIHQRRKHPDRLVRRGKANRRNLTYPRILLKADAYGPASSSRSDLRDLARAPRKCVSIGIVKRSARTQRMEASSPLLVRWGAAAACLGGISYGTWGYLDNPDASGFVIGTVVPVLELITPTLFLGGIVGLYSWLGRGGGLLQRTGLLVGSLGTVLGMVDGLDWWESDWWALLFAGLTAVGVGTFVEGAPRLLGSLVLASGTLGLVSLLTDPAFTGALVPMRPVHVAFAALFCLSSVAWGSLLFRGAS